jgi:hypothetical protein
MEPLWSQNIMNPESLTGLQQAPSAEREGEGKENFQVGEVGESNKPDRRLRYWVSCNNIN